MKNNNSYVLNYHQIKKIIEKYFLSQGKNVKVKIKFDRVYEGILNPHVVPIFIINKNESNNYLLEDELEEIINNFLEKDGKELLSLISNVSFKKIFSSPNKDYCSLYSKNWLTDKTFTIYYKKKTINNENSLELANKTSKHIQDKFETAEEFTENVPVKKLTKKNNK